MRELDPLLHNRTRLAILTLLLKNGKMDFKSLRDELGLTDGNLATHLRVLENEGIVKYEKTFVGRKPITYYELTPKGRKRFINYLKSLRDLLRELEIDL